MFEIIFQIHLVCFHFVFIGQDDLCLKKSVIFIPSQTLLKPLLVEILNIFTLQLL